MVLLERKEAMAKKLRAAALAQTAAVRKIKTAAPVQTAVWAVAALVCRMVA